MCPVWLESLVKGAFLLEAVNKVAGQQRRASRCDENSVGFKQSLENSLDVGIGDEIRSHSSQRMFRAVLGVNHLLKSVNEEGAARVAEIDVDILAKGPVEAFNDLNLHVIFFW